MATSNSGFQKFKNKTKVSGDVLGSPNSKKCTELPGYRGDTECQTYSRGDVNGCECSSDYSVWNKTVESRRDGASPRARLYVCAMSALLTTLGSVAGKLVFPQKPPPVLAPLYDCWAQYLVRSTAVMLLILSNTLAVKYYARSLLEYSAFQATGICFVFNFIMSGLTGVIFFSEERLSWRWFIGSLIMALGVSFLYQQRRAP